MRVIYFDCFGGASGDMLLGALLDAGASLDRLNAGLARLGLGLRVRAGRVKRAGLSALKADVLYGDWQAEDAPQTPEHHHRGLREIRGLLQVPGLDHEVITRAVRVFERLADAEAAVHGVEPESVHFHEVGALDAIGDVLGACLCLADLGVSEVLFSRLPTGGGTVRAAHGLLPVPAPATMRLLRGLAVYDPGVEYEMVTPTGAAVLTALGTQVDRWPSMTVQAIGIGAGGRDTPRPNIVRAILGDVSAGIPARDGAHEWAAETVLALETNLDDVSGQIVAAAVERLIASGALDAWWSPCGMKKGRPGVQITCLTRGEDLDRMASVLFSELPTLGVRLYEVRRFILEREHQPVSTPWGEVRVKVGRLRGRVLVASPEFEDCKQVAEAAGVPVRAVMNAALAAAHGSDIKIET
jgi:uncharacterized protein (TIGR00299 family) protein